MEKEVCLIPIEHTKHTNADISKNEYCCADCKKYCYIDRLQGKCEYEDETFPLNKAGHKFSKKPYTDRIINIIKEIGTNGLGDDIYLRHSQGKTTKEDVKRITELEKELTNLV